MLKMTDKRSFKTLVKLNTDSDYAKTEVYLDYWNYIDTTELFM